MRLKKHKFRVAIGAITCALVFCVLLQPGRVLSQAPFYQGKNLTIVSGQAPGGTGDMRLRAVIPYLRKHIPGQPNIVPEYMPGAGGRKAANHIYRTARPDGLTLGFPSGGFIVFAVLGESGVNYDLRKLIFLGTPESSDQYIFLTRKESNLSSLDKLRSTPGIRIGAQSVGHTIYTLGRLFAYILRLREPKFITGYSGTELDAALLRGEVDARVNRIPTILQRSPELVEKGMADFHATLQIPSSTPHPRFSQVPDIETFATSDKARNLLAVNRLFRMTGASFIFPPGVPKERVQILEEAMRKTFDDPEFHKEFTKLVGEGPSPLMPEELRNAVQSLPRDPGTVELYKKLIGGGPLPPD